MLEGVNWKLKLLKYMSEILHSNLICCYMLNMIHPSHILPGHCYNYIPLHIISHILLETPPSEAFLAGLNIDRPVSILLIATKVGSNCSKLTLKTAQQ